LISDDWRGTTEVNGKKLAELDDGRLLVFTEAGWFTGAVCVMVNSVSGDGLALI
jgi:hypothetical protein